MSPKTPAWGESTQSSTYVRALACFNIIMYYNQLQYAEREKICEPAQLIWTNEREILTGILISRRRGAEDTRVHILHVIRSSMQNGVKPPRVLVIETWHPWGVGPWYLVISKGTWPNAKANSHVSWDLKVPPRMGVNPKETLRSLERNPGTILKRTMSICKYTHVLCMTCIIHLKRSLDNLKLSESS